MSDNNSSKSQIQAAKEAVKAAKQADAASKKALADAKKALEAARKKSAKEKARAAREEAKRKAAAMRQKKQKKAKALNKKKMKKMSISKPQKAPAQQQPGSAHYKGAFGIREIIFKENEANPPSSDAEALSSLGLLKTPSEPQGPAHVQQQQQQVKQQKVLPEAEEAKKAEDEEALPVAVCCESSTAWEAAAPPAGGLDVQVKIVGAPATDFVESNTEQQTQQTEQQLPKNTVDAKASPAVAANESGGGGAAASSKEDTVVGVIFTIAGSCTYDALFQKVKQDAPDGECVRVYEVEAAFIPWLHRALVQATPDILEGDASTKVRGVVERAIHGFLPVDEALRLRVVSLLERAVTEVADIEPEAVVVNFECCGNCNSTTGFAQPSACPHVVDGQPSRTLADPTVQFIAAAVERGFLVMVSDFSLKALIATWKDEHPVLGENPFHKLGEFSQRFTLQFDPAVLEDCCSAQLTILGEMSSEGKAESHAMSGTILFGVDHEVADRSCFDLEVLTVMTSFGGRSAKTVDRKYQVSVAGISGAAGHVALTYPSGGIILASAGHWVELQKVKTDEKSFFNVMANEYGATSKRNQQLRMEYDELPSEAAKNVWLQANAQTHVQSRSCAVYSLSKSKWGAAQKGKAKKKGLW